MTGPDATGAASGVRLPIDRIELFALDIVPARKRQIPTGALSYGGRSSWVGRPVMVMVHAGGVSGVGEVRPVNPFVGETAASMFAALRDFYAPRVIGRDALRIVERLRDCEAVLPGNPAALGALDIALHDLVGKALGVPVHALLGGACKDSIPLEWSVGLADEATMAREAAWAVEHLAVPYVCLKVGPSHRLEADVSTIAAVRRAIGPRVRLGLDANTTYDPVGAVRLMERVAEHDIAYFEQPLPARALVDMRRLRDQTRVAVLADESLFTPADAVAIIQAGAADVLGVKFYKCAGLRRSREIAAIADAAALPVNCAGTANGSGLEAVAGTHLCASVPNHAFGAEFVMGLPAVEPDARILRPPVDARDGHANVPQLPGLGVEIDRAVVERLALAHETIRS